MHEGGREFDAGGAVGLPHFHAGVGTQAFTLIRPGLHPFKQGLGCQVDGTDPIVGNGRQLGIRGLPFNHRYLETTVLQRQRQGQPHHAATNHDHICRLHALPLAHGPPGQFVFSHAAGRHGHQSQVASGSQCRVVARKQ